MITPAPGNKQNILVDFECIVDVDYGILLYVNDLLKDDERVSHQLIDNTTYFERLGLIHDNDSTNPVRILFMPEDYDYADDLYEEIMSKDIDKVLQLSTVTEMFNFSISALLTKGMCDVNILCRKKEYIDIVNKIYSDDIDITYLSTHLFEDDGENKFDVRPYSALFIRHAQELFTMDNVDGKTIYFQQCRTNINLDLYERGLGIAPNIKIGSLFAPNNRVLTFSIYEYDKGYFIDRNYKYGDPNYNEVKQPEFLDEDEEPPEDTVSRTATPDELNAYQFFQGMIIRPDDNDLGIIEDDDPDYLEVDPNETISDEDIKLVKEQFNEED